MQQQLTIYTQLAQANKYYPPSLVPAERLLNYLVCVLHIRSIDDEELYGYWKQYKEEKTRWISTTFPNYKAATSDTILAVLGITRKQLILLIAAAQQYLENYAAHKENIVGEQMQKIFKQHQLQVEEDLKNSQQGWLYVQQLLDQQYRALLLEQQFLKELKRDIETYNKLLKAWNTRVLPNVKALLTDQKDVVTLEKIVAVLEKMSLLLEKAPKSVQKAAKAWTTLINSGKWKERQQLIKKSYLSSTKRRQQDVQENTNPPISTIEARGIYHYQPPHKKDRLYNKGKGDAHEIAANDVQQGDLEDCFVLGPIAALAQSNPAALQKLIAVQQDGSYKVTLFLRTNSDSMERQQVVISVKNEFVRDKNGRAAYAGMGDRELWVQVLEKAYAQAMGHFNTIAEGGDAGEILEVLTGKKQPKLL